MEFGLVKRTVGELLIKPCSTLINKGLKAVNLYTEALMLIDQYGRQLLNKPGKTWKPIFISISRPGSFSAHFSEVL